MIDFRAAPKAHPRRRVAAAFAAAACLLAMPAAGPATAAPRSAASPSAGDGSWWYSALHIAQDHQIADGKGITIALLDGPVDNAVPELRGQKVIAGGAYCDDEKTHTLRTTPFATGRRASFHATSMAALLVGSGKGTRPDGTGLRGVAPGATLRVYAISGPDSQEFQCFDSKARNPYHRALTGIWTGVAKQAVDDGADILVMPFTSQELDQSWATYAAEHGAVAVAAVSNGISGLTGKKEYGLVGFPASDLGVVSATAVDVHGLVFPQAARGRRVIISAPGVDINSGSFDAQGRWSSAGRSTGSSASTAIVGGMLAVVKSKYPQATPAQLVQHLIRHTTSPKVAWNDTYGYGYASLTRMLAADPTRNPDVNPLLKQVFNTKDVSPYTTPLLTTPVTAAAPSAATPPSAGAPGSTASGPAELSRRSATSPSHATPAWVLPVAIATGLFVVATAGGISLRRRRTSTPTEPTQGG